MGTVFKVQEAPTVNVTGTGDSFPVHRIYCVGQNYANHVREMGANPEREAPFSSANLQIQFVRKVPKCRILWQLLICTMK